MVLHAVYRYFLLGSLQRVKLSVNIGVNVNLGSYKELHEWSVNNYAEFWDECFHFFDILHSAPYSQVQKM